MSQTDLARHKQRHKYATRRQSGLCVKCGTLARPGKSLCEGCAAAWAEYLRVRYRRMVDAAKKSRAA